MFSSPVFPLYCFRNYIWTRGSRDARTLYTRYTIVSSIYKASKRGYGGVKEMEEGIAGEIHRQQFEKPVIYFAVKEG